MNSATFQGAMASGAIALMGWLSSLATIKTITLAQAAIPEPTPTGIVAAFIAITSLSFGALVWMLKRQADTLDKFAAAASETAAALTKISDRIPRSQP